MVAPSKQQTTRQRAQTGDGQVSHPVRNITVDLECAGQRVDNFILARCKGMPRSHAYRLLRTGQVRVNGGRVKPPHRLCEGDLVRLPPVRIKSDVVPGAGAVASVLRTLEGQVLFEDSRLLILNKPAGIAVHGGSGIKVGIVEALRELRSDLRQVELVHRLDRGTSGCLLLAKRRSALRALHEQFRAGTVEKRYLALGRGQLSEPKQRVSAPLLKIERGGEHMVVVSPEGRESISHFRANRVYSNATLMEVLLETGRTHQIRAHANHIGLPLAGDEKYGDPEFNRKMAKIGLRRLFLHARSLRFTHPGDGQVITQNAPLPDTLKQLMKKLESDLIE